MAARSVAASLARSHLSAVVQELPVFALPRLVLMPGSMLPLHIFEPRYQELLRHCMGHNRLLGIATLRPGYEQEYEGNPALYPEVGIGLVVRHEPVADGRSNVLVEHIARGRLGEEVDSHHAFRLFRVQVKGDTADIAATPMAQLKALLMQIASMRPEARDEAERIARLPAADMLDDLARRLLNTPDEQRAYCALDRHSERAALLNVRLGTVLSPTGTPVAEA